MSALLLAVALALCYLASAADPSPLQDFCVADSTNQVRMNGFACKNPATVQASDFSFSGLHNPANTANAVGSFVTPVTVTQIPGLNTLGISMGTLEVGFVTSNPENRLISKILQKGDVFVFPIGLIHFQRNVGYGNAVAIAALSSQNPGVITIANSVFGSKPDIASDILAKAFMVDKSIVQKLQWNF
ncbi:Putative germin-like protein 2-1 [Linum grandiflorum]